MKAICATGMPTPRIGISHWYLPACKISAEPMISAATTTLNAAQDL